MARQTCSLAQCGGELTLRWWRTDAASIPPQGVRVLATAADVEALLIEVTEGLKARGYARSELMDLHVKQMSGNTALVSVSRVRQATDGRELERLGESYTLRRTEGCWKIAVGDDSRL
jgi:Domain of unknown function (DUF4440)